MSGDGRKIGRRSVNRLMWDARTGLYYDYDFVHKRVRHYPFLTTFYPLWAGIAHGAGRDECRATCRLFETTGGLQTSTNRKRESMGLAVRVGAVANDCGRGTAAIRLFGGRGTHLNEISIARAARVSSHGYIVEKYDVVQGGSNVSGNIHFGYSANQAGFGWTNAVFEALYDALMPENKRKLMNMSGE